MALTSFSLTNKKIDELTSVLQDVITLVGPEREEAVTLENGVTIRPGLNMHDDAATLQKCLTDINQGLFTLLILGEFNNGKSTLLNAMLGEKVLPAKGIPTTAIITVLVHGEGDQVAIYRANVQEPEYISWAEFTKSYRLTRADAPRLEEGETLDKYQNIEYAQLESTHPICANRVRLVDSPGLGEHVSRTHLTTTFLKQAQAVVFVLSAMQPLTQNERDFIEEELGEGRLENVFFVINRINQIDRDEVDDIKEWFELGLSHHFCNEAGEFDPVFYNKRVFFVNALGALKARSATPIDQELLCVSKIPFLEDALQNFLKSDDRSTAIYESTQALLTRIEQEAQKRISRRKEALNRPINQLKESQKEAERGLSDLRQQQEAIAKEIISTGEELYGLLRVNFSEYIGKMKERWPREPVEVVNLSAIDPKELVESLDKPRKRKKLERKINQIVTDYLDIKFKQWAQSGQDDVMQHIKKLQKNINKQIIEFTQEINRIQHRFAFGEENPITSLANEVDTGHLAQTIAIEGDWSVTISNSLGPLVNGLRYLGAEAIQIYVFFEKFNRSLASLLGQYGKTVVFIRDKRLLEEFRQKLGQQIHQALTHEVSREVFVENNIKDLPRLAKKLIAKKDPLSAYIWDKLSIPTLKQLEELVNRGDESTTLRQDLVNDLNRIVERNESIYEAERFAGIPLRDKTKNRLSQPNLGTSKLASLNRWLLTEAYPEEIADKLQDVIYHNFIYQFTQLAHQTTQPLQARIDEVLSEMENVINELETETSKVENEIQRLHKIEETFNTLLAVVQPETE